MRYHLLQPTFLELAGWRSLEQPDTWKPPAQMDGRSFASKLMGTTAATSVVSTPLPERKEFLLEFTGLKTWPSDEKNGVCPSSGCHRLNDCPNNTYRALRIKTPTNVSYMAGLSGNLL